MTRPPTDLPGLDPAWSRTIRVTDAEARAYDWHVLDSAPNQPVPSSQPTLLCLHGNPTWSYLWRRLLAAAPAGWRVVAPDQLGMGYSERLEAPRTLAQRVSDLGDLTAAMGIAGPVITVAHDWGGIISLGWALDHPDQLAGVVLTNTAVHQPEDSRPPVLIRLAHLGALRDTACVRTPLFVRGATALSWPPLPREVRNAFAAPYRGAARRQSVGDFVADIPFGEHDPSRPALDRISDGIRALTVPALLMWGPRDPVFGEQYLRDLRRRLPHADVHRYEGASHLLPEDAPSYAAAIVDWVGQLSANPKPDPNPRARPDPLDSTLTVTPVWQALHDRAGSTPLEIAAADVGGASIGWAELSSRVDEFAAGLSAAGVKPGHRVALLVEPSIELTIAVYAVWRAGASIVVADKGLGLAGMGRALRGAGAQHVIGRRSGLLAARLMRLTGSRFLVRPSRPIARRALGATCYSPGDPSRPRPAFDPDAEAAVVFTSGATGPAKGVVYQHHQLRAQLDTIRSAYGLTSTDRIVAAFAPFALYGPALGLASAVPNMDVTKPGTLTAGALAEAVLAVEATVVFGSPAALRNLISTSSDLTQRQRQALNGVRLLMSAGAPVPARLLEQIRELLPNAQAHTPYGMTEVLPVTDVSLTAINIAGEGDGICVGPALPGVTIAISELDSLGRALSQPIEKADVTGEICVRTAHSKERYDALWATEWASSRDPGWHRTGDVGYLDPQGRLWVQGRIQHLITTPTGVITPVGLELRLGALPSLRAAAVVGVGPAGTQVVVVVVLPASPPRRWSTPVADLELVDAVRAASPVPIAAVLTRRSLPVDIRHASKVDRTALAEWASKALAGRS
ncbi:MAG: AMP-dependent synthetase and ligase [Pseudonocardiales bacterium]|nr:AMP-dependent synthetase and ligase [Pseudonocardiales bacterium]